MTYHFVSADPHGKSAVDGALLLCPSSTVTSLPKIKSIF